MGSPECGHSAGTEATWLVSRAGEVFRVTCVNAPITTRMHRDGFRRRAIDAATPGRSMP